jgi:hypothetical protein
MKKLAIGIIIITVTALICIHNATAANLTLNSTSVDVDGNLKLTTPGSAYCFADLTCMTTALVNDGTAIWGQITGLIANQTDLQTQMNTKEDKSNKGIANGYASLDANTQLPFSQHPHIGVYLRKPNMVGYTPSWQSQGDSWVEMTEFLTMFTKQLPGSRVKLTYQDNIGIAGNLWCVVGIFIDDRQTPVCAGSWSGSPYYTLFGQQSFSCYISPGDGAIASTGTHTVKIKHKSENCVYGNYAFDSSSTLRQLEIVEVP